MTVSTSPTEERTPAPRRGAAPARRRIIALIAVLVILAAWQAASTALGSPIILPSPAETLGSVFKLVVTGEFWSAVGATVGRGFAGFLISCAAGCAIGWLAGWSPTARAFVNPFVTVIRSTPVMSVILLALIWFHTDVVPVFVAFLMVFPIICGNVAEGMQSIDRQLLEMARTYEVPKRRELTGIVIPSVFPFFIAAISTSLGITWKVVVAAEVLAQPIHAIGTDLQLAKVRLDTAEVFAWTFVAILLSAASDAIILLVERRVPWRNRFNGS